MLLIILFWILVSVSFLGWGKIFTSVLGPKAILEDFSETGHFFVGLSVCGILSGMWWCVAPITPGFGGILMGAGIGYGIASWPSHFHIQFKNPWFIATCVLFALAIAMKAAAPGSFYDSGLYYVQTIRWAQAHSVVPGLANLHVRFGNASMWHVLVAAYDWPQILGGDIDDLGELILLWFVVFHGWNGYKRSGFERYLSLSLVFFAIWQSKHLLTAPTPDLASGILGMQTLWQFRKFLKAWNPKESNQLNTRGLALFAQSLFLAQIKLSAIPFLIVAVLVNFLVIRKGWIISAINLVAFGLVVALSMVYRSYILSGYALFPVFSGGLSPDWLIPKTIVTEYLDGVRGFARHILTPAELANGLTYSKLGRLQFWDWFPIWAKDRKWNEWMVILMAVSGWLLLVRFASSHIRRSFKDHWPLIFFTWLSGMMLLFWFSNAPDVRFGMAILGMGLSYSMAAILLRISTTLNFIGHIKFYELASVAIAIWAVVWYADGRSLKQYAWVPPLYHHVEPAVYKNFQGHSMFTPADTEDPYADADQCWDSPLPCSQNAMPGLLWRGKTAADGFKFPSSTGVKK